MMMRSHQTAPTQFVEANGIRFAYRRFGKTGGMPMRSTNVRRQLPAMIRMPRFHFEGIEVRGDNEWQK